MNLYRVDTSKLRLREARRIGGLLLALTTALRINLAGKEPTLCDTKVNPLKPEELPLEVAQDMLPHFEVAQELGLGLLIAFETDTVNPADCCFGALYSNEERTSTLMLQYVRTGEEKEVRFVCRSRLTKGSEVVDCSGKQKFDSDGDTLGFFHGKIDLKAIWEIHRERIKNENLKPLEQNLDLVEHVRSEGQEFIDEGLKRGFLVQLPGTLEEHRARREEAEAGGQHWFFRSNEPLLAAKDRSALSLQSSKSLLGAWIIRPLFGLSVLAMLMSLHYIADWYHLTHHATPVMGKVLVKVYDAGDSESPATFTVGWSYLVGEEFYSGSEKVPKGVYNSLKEGGEVPLIVDEDMPSHSLIKGETGLSQYAPSSFAGLAFFGLMGITFLLQKRQEAQDLLLRNEGKLVEGVILGTEVERESEGPDTLNVRFELSTDEGSRSLKLNIGRLPDEMPIEGQAIQALYLDDKNFGLL